MRHPRPRTLFIPVLGLLAAILVLLAVVMITTYVNLDRGRKQARHVLETQSTAIVSGLSAGLSTGWRHRMWRDDSLQELVAEASGFGDVAFIAIMDKQDRVLAHTDRSLLNQVYPQISDLRKNLKSGEITSWFGRGEIFLSGRILTNEDFTGGGSSRGRHGMGRMHGRMMEMNEEYTPSLILVGLETTHYNEALSRQFQHSLIMAGILFVLGAGAIYFIFVLQNYRTIDRTLSDLSTYTASIVDNMPTGLITLDGSGEPVMVNRAARQMFGWDDRAESSLGGEPVIKGLSEKFGPELREGRIILEKEFEAPIADNDHLPVAVSAAAGSSGEGESGEVGQVYILRDLRQIRDLENQVRQSEKLAAVGGLAAGVAHEVRNPLSSMRGLANFLTRSLDEKSREAEYLRVMIEEIDRINRVITGLLDFARPRTPELAPVDFNEVARHTSDLVTDDARGRSISVREDMAPDKPLIRADRDQVIQSMLNLLLNAIEAMPDGGRMTVSTKKENGCGVFMVEDTGPGVPYKDRSKLADPFFTTKKKGSGLGLAQTAGIMEAHGGRLEIGGEPGMGARIMLFFPLYEED